MANGIRKLSVISGSIQCPLIGGRNSAPLLVSAGEMVPYCWYLGEKCSIMMSVDGMVPQGLDKSKGPQFGDHWNR